jgi:hypothetical protein
MLVFLGKKFEISARLGARHARDDAQGAVAGE